MFPRQAHTGKYSLSKVVAVPREDAGDIMHIVMAVEGEMPSPITGRYPLFKIVTPDDCHE